MLKKQPIPFPVVILSLVSLFNDIAAEMIYPVVPLFLTGVLKTSLPVVGLIEGISEAAASLGKYYFGALSDLVRRRKLFVTLGYGFSAASKLLFWTAFGWPVVLAARLVDRTGKGLRTAPRDSILMENSTEKNRGFIFGFHRSLDSLGAVIGPLIAILLLSVMKDNLRAVFLMAFIPSFIGILLLVFFIREKRQPGQTAGRPSFGIRLKDIDPRLMVFFAASIVFSIGNSSDAFIILRAKDLGLTTVASIMAYVLYNLSQTIFATPAGRLSDRIGSRRVFTIGLLLFAAVYLLFGLAGSGTWFWFLFPIYGLYIAFTDGVSKAYVSQYASREKSASFFGLYYTVIAVGNFLASFIAGWLWEKVSPAAVFYYGAAMAAAAFVILAAVRPPRLVGSS